MSSHASTNNVPLTPRQKAAILDERRRTALHEIDIAPWSWFHFKVCIVAGIGFFTDAYDMFAINIAVTMLGFTYGNGVSFPILWRC